MPVYTYVCKDCGEKFDLLMGITSEKPKLKCKRCNSKNVERVLSAFSIGGSKDESSSGSTCPTGTCPTSF
jgi:putative FmdB family regulatory protein